MCSQHLLNTRRKKLQECCIVYSIYFSIRKWNDSAKFRDGTAFGPSQQQQHGNMTQWMNRRRYSLEQCVVGWSRQFGRSCSCSGGSSVREGEGLWWSHKGQLLKSRTWRQQRRDWEAKLDHAPFYRGFRWTSIIIANVVGWSKDKGTWNRDWTSFMHWVPFKT